MIELRKELFHGQRFEIILCNRGFPSISQSAVWSKSVIGGGLGVFGNGIFI